MSLSSDTRHLNPASLLEHWHSGVPVLVPIAGEPEVLLRVDGPQHVLALRIAASGPIVLPPDTLAHVRSEVISQGGRQFVEVSVVGAYEHQDGYAILSAVADRVQLEGMDPVEAIATTTDAWHRILARRSRMSGDAEVGLFGEMLVLRALSSGDPAASLLWRGGAAEEHDYDFGSYDVEVKTTSGERRRHWIHGVDQLQEAPNRPLWLLSLQITRGSAPDACSLSQLVEEVLRATSHTLREELLTRLASAGWHRAQHDLFPDRWRLRAAVLAFRIDNEFPRITSTALGDAGIQLARIDQITYKVDVTDLDPSAPLPSALQAAIRTMETVNA